MNKQVYRIILALAVTCMAATQPARGGLLTPNGNPTGPASSTSPTQPDGYRYIVSLNPTQAFINDALTAPSPLTLALNAQGYTAANGWNITYRDLAGDVRLDTYYAWTENRPAVAEGTLLVAGAAVPG